MKLTTEGSCATQGMAGHSRGIDWHGNSQQAGDDIHKPMGKVGPDKIEFVILATVLVPVIPRGGYAFGTRDCEEGLEPRA